MIGLEEEMQVERLFLGCVRWKIKLINRSLFITAHQIEDRNFYPTYNYLIKNQWKNCKELKEEQEKGLRAMINFAYKNVPYYHKLFDDLKLSPDEIKKIEDLEKLPILTKEIIKQNWGDFKPVNLNKMKYYEGATGGSTGTPFKYRLSKSDRFLGGALLYRGWRYAGYELGDKMVFLAGASLDIGTQSYLTKRVHEIVRNIKKLSVFDMGEKEMQEYVSIINSFKPKFLRGYASSIYFFAKWIEENNIAIHQPLAVFTTTEKLYPRSIMEVVDKDGNQLENGEGEILATSLYNYAMPFIRYDTGDLGYIIDGVCGCGREYKLLKEVVGRSVDVLVTPEGKNVHGWFFLYIFWEYCKGIKEYQVVQEKIDKIEIKIVPEEDFDEKQLEKIREIIKRRSEGWNVEFEFVDKIERTGAGKYKFIINEMER
jgi:phenylacetate-CoA ligase